MKKSRPILKTFIYVEQLLFREIEDQRLDLFRQVQQELQEQPREIFVLPDQEQCKVEAPPNRLGVGR